MIPTPYVRYAHQSADVDERAAIAERNQRERDARRANYIDAYASMPIARALDAMRVNVLASTPNAFAPRPPKLHKDWSLGTCDHHGKPWVGKYRCRRCDPTKNAWESRAPHSRAHIAPDHTCHHPLVRCTHKW